MTCSCPTCGQTLPAATFTFNREAGIVVRDGSYVVLPRREADVFAVLLDRRGRVATRSSLFQAVYAGDDEPEGEEVIESHVCKLRSKLRSLGLSVRSERFKGYWLSEISP